MPDSIVERNRRRVVIPRWFWFFLVAGWFLTLRGYHSFDGDQAYRLPLLLHQQNLEVYSDDPFVRAFDRFNPHRGYLALLNVASRPLGLATALFGLFAMTLGATILGVDRLSRAVWPGLDGRVGLVAVVLILAAKAGNIGTNHLFEATLLDRLVAFSIGWLALSFATRDPSRGVWIAAPLLGVATLIHPSVGLQLSLTLASAWVVWCFRPGSPDVRPIGAFRSIMVLGVALIPGLALIGGQSGQLLEGMPLDEFRHWAVEVQGPQHMLPSTWRQPQWLAFGCYPLLAGLALFGCRERTSLSPTTTRFGWLMAVNLFSLTLAYVAVDVVGNLRVTLFQPFRMATLSRGLALIVISGRLVALWDRGDVISRGRAVLVAVSLTGDWSLVVASGVELVMTLAEAWRPGLSRWVINGLGVTALGLGLILLAKHDLESGSLAILGSLGTLVIGTGLARVWPLSWNRRRLLFVAVLAWALPASAFVAGLIGGDDAGDDRIRAGLLGRCRFAEVAVGDDERIAAWCRDQTPPSSRFIGPPGEKEFRLWSRRSLAFNRAGSPYHALGLLDWSERFRDHVGFDGSSADFARAYLAGRHRLEANYDRMTPEAKIALARRQGATHILERFDGKSPAQSTGLELLKTIGHYAVYRVR